MTHVLCHSIAFMVRNLLQLGDRVGKNTTVEPTTGTTTPEADPSCSRWCLHVKWQMSSWLVNSLSVYASLCMIYRINWIMAGSFGRIFKPRDSDTRFYGYLNTKIDDKPRNIKKPCRSLQFHNLRQPRLGSFGLTWLMLAQSTSTIWARGKSTDCFQVATKE